MSILPEIIYSITAFCDHATKAHCALVSKQWSANINWSTDEYRAHFYNAMRKGDKTVIRRLLQRPVFNKVLRDTKDGGNWLLRWACFRGLSEAVEALLEDKRFDPAWDDNEYVVLASCYGGPKTVKLLISDPRVDPSANDNAAIREAARDGKLEAVRLLMEDPRVDPSALKNEAIHRASMAHDGDMVELLLQDPRVDPSSDENFAICEACDSSDPHDMCRTDKQVKTVLTLLNDPRVNPAAEDNTPVCNASTGLPEVLYLLLMDPRVDPAANDNEAFFEARDHRRVENMVMLAKDPRVDPISSAIENGWTDLILDLLKEGYANPAANDNRSIRYACRNGTSWEEAGNVMLDVVRLLLTDERVDPTAQNDYAIRKASEDGLLDVVRLLLEDGRANPAAENNAAVRIAQERGHNDIVELLASDPRVSINKRRRIDDEVYFHRPYF